MGQNLPVVATDLRNFLTGFRRLRRLPPPGPAPEPHTKIQGDYNGDNRFPSTSASSASLSHSQVAKASSVFSSVYETMEPRAVSVCQFLPSTATVKSPPIGTSGANPTERPNVELACHRPRWVRFTTFLQSCQPQFMASFFFPTTGGTHMLKPPSYFGRAVCDSKAFHIARLLAR